MHHAVRLDADDLSHPIHALRCPLGLERLIRVPVPCSVTSSAGTGTPGGRQPVALMVMPKVWRGVVVERVETPDREDQEDSAAGSEPLFPDKTLADVIAESTDQG